MTLRPKPFNTTKILQVIGGLVFAYLFFGFMLLPCLNTLTSIFREKNDGVRIYEEGQEVEVVIDPRDLMAYAPGGEAEVEA